MRGLVIWLMGEELGESIMKSLHWLLETPPDRSQTQGKTSDEITIEHITEVLESIEFDESLMKFNIVTTSSVSATRS
jgi:hypothetical protein